MTQAEALDILKTGENCYVTGAAGSGKTHLVNTYIKYLKKHGVEVGVTASTGIAATHMGGQTIHSWIGLGVANHVTDADLERFEGKKYLVDRLRATSVLIIDEVSMLHHFRLDLIDRIARHLKKNEHPFGGMQVVLVGDFFQLPPVSRAGEPEALFAYKSESWKRLALRICYLEEQHRQTDDALTNILNDIRRGRMTDASHAHMKSRFGAKLPENVAAAKLHTHNVNVDSINDAELAKLPGAMFAFKMEEKGRQALVDALKKSCLAPDMLRLKIGARVMFVKNNFDAGYANGTLGKVVSCDMSGPKVMLANGKIIVPEKESWIVEEDGKTKATITQYPLRLAWAITVHKSQGMSLDAAEIDLSQSFERGMGYVALSRVRTLSGLRLSGLNENALQVRGDVAEFDEELQEISSDNRTWLHSLSDTEVKEKQAAFLAKIAPAGDAKVGKAKRRKITPVESTRTMLAEGMKLREIVSHKGVTLGTILDHIEKILDKEPDFDIAHLRDEVPPGKFKKIYLTFRDMFGENRELLLAPVKNKLGAGFTYEELRLVRLFVRKSV
ncbi:MAG: AAA family ATPase [Patescibacteria group bacterium]|nr:AAA family ATPase [Patescibacteria group bacterium]MDE1946158.1 AAA family ATPase [Patescibacteria group bacterium]